MKCTTLAMVSGLATLVLACAHEGPAAEGSHGGPRGDAALAPAQAPSSLPASAGASAANGPSAQGQPQAGPAPSHGPVALGQIVPLFDAATVLEPEVLFDRGDAVVTRFGDRARDRHAREDQFQSYDHYLPFYWEYRTNRLVFVDRVAKGGTSLDVSFVTEWKLGPPEFRAWYNGNGSVAQYSGNYAPRFTVEGPGTYDIDNHKIDSNGKQYRYSYTIQSAITLDGKEVPLAVGQFMELEVSQFLDAPPRGRQNYYGTVFLYEIGAGGLVPWYKVGDFDDKSSERENSHRLEDRAWLGGRTTLAYQYSDEHDNHFMQMATNLAGHNAQPFVRGRRIDHTDMEDGSHDESEENGIYGELTNLVGPYFVNRSCDACHTRNGRAAVPAVGTPLDKWVFKIAGSDGHSDPLLGSVLQPGTVTSGAHGEGNVSIAEWLDKGAGLRAPRYAFVGASPALFSARLAPQLVGLGLLEALDEATILALADEMDADGDGISGKPQLALDPVTHATRLGRFGWKAGASSLKHQVAGALNTDMGVMTSVLPHPDCGSAQQGCGNQSGPELTDEALSELVKYISLLGVPARRAMQDDDALRGEQHFEELGCASCHRTSLTTSRYHPLAELRGQLIHPYTDLLLHDMGPGLADNLGENEATGPEWRTTPLWGIGLSACVTGGVVGPPQKQVCSPSASYLHDGRARTLEEAILWHGGEGEAARKAYAALAEKERSAVLTFLGSL